MERTSNQQAVLRFQKDLATLLLVFVASALIDFTVVSLFSGVFRFWFPNWFYPGWNEDPNTWITYSQSYMAGILFIPWLVYLVVRDFFSHWSAGKKAIIVGAGALVLAFVGWWKGSLTLEFHRGTEAVAWAVLAAILLGIIKLAQALPSWISRFQGTRFLRGLCLVFASVFLVMSVVDPLIQLGIHDLGWSSGLLIEIGFYSSAAIFAWFAAKRWFGEGVTT